MSSSDSQIQKQFLGDFKNAYHRCGKFNLKPQSPHLAKLAEIYQQRYTLSGDWTHCIKAHALYNSAAVREPESHEWRTRVFQVQKEYLRSNSVSNFQQHGALTVCLKQELKSIRDQLRVEMLEADEIVTHFDHKNVDDVTYSTFYDCMKNISISSSEGMTSFAKHVIEKSVALLVPTEPPCDFTAIAIGSLARGEATPYSDLEYIFLIEEQTPENIAYFERLAITSYFLIGNLGETKLAYMAVDELKGWFDDKSQNGFKIDGLSAAAGNIPTGNATTCAPNHFIVTPQELADRYIAVLNNPDDSALRGDLTAMLTYIKLIYSYPENKMDLLKKLRTAINEATPNTARSDMNLKMLCTDVKKFNFQPSEKLESKGFTADVKKELYRFPSILLLDISIVTGITRQSSWETLEALDDSGTVSHYLSNVLKFLLAAATYVRLSAYLYHDSQDDRMSVTNRFSKYPHSVRAAMSSSQSQRRWFVPGGLFTNMCEMFIPLKLTLAATVQTVSDLATLSSEADQAWTRVSTLYYAGRYPEALASLKQMYGEKLTENPLLTLPQSEHTKADILRIVQETLYACGEFKAALILYDHMTNTGMSDQRSRIAACYREIGKLTQSVEILENITDVAEDAGRFYALGDTYRDLVISKKSYQGLRSLDYKKAEEMYLSALELYYSDTSTEPLYDYYGDPIQPNDESKSDVKVDFKVASPQKRLSMIINSSPNVINCVVSLGSIYSKEKQHALAEAYYKKSLELIYTLYGEDAAIPGTASTLNLLGQNYNDMGKLIEADEHLKQGLAMYKELSQYGKEGHDSAVTLNNLGWNSDNLGRHSEAIEYYKEAVKVYRWLSYGGQNLKIARALNNIGWTYYKMGKYSETEDYCKQSLAIHREVSKGDTLSIANTLDTLGWSYRDEGKAEKAIQTLVEALDIYNRLDARNAQVPVIRAYLSRRGEEDGEPSSKRSKAD